MGRRMVPLTLDVLGDLPEASRRCVFWELDAVAAKQAAAAGYPDFEKEVWFSTVLLQWGPCGRLLYVDDELAGFVVYAPPVFSPRAGAFPTSPVSGDAVLLMTGWVRPDQRGGGLARMLVQGAAKDLTKRGFKAIEAFGVAAPPADPADTACTPGAHEGDCLLPEAMLLSVGFTTVRPHHRYPRLRLELRSALAWREDVEQALERLLGSVRVPALSGLGAPPATT
ncbi:GNAT family N-acetyltransferase [Kineococcus glutinatus]|uniref:GNAT family N-acetyltransferase n=1 Tax=Kineococcus glutinatus TaxID=1070872 RepID=A0ABP9H6Y8_9ACTN